MRILRTELWGNPGADCGIGGALQDLFQPSHQRFGCFLSPDGLRPAGVIGSGWPLKPPILIYQFTSCLQFWCPFPIACVRWNLVISSLQLSIPALCDNNRPCFQLGFHNKPTIKRRKLWHFWDRAHKGGLKFVGLSFLSRKSICVFKMVPLGNFSMQIKLSDFWRFLQKGCFFERRIKHRLLFMGTLYPISAKLLLNK